MNALSMLCVNAVCLIDQVRNLRWMGFRVPLLLVNKANQANHLYPHAVSLMESMRTYELTYEKIVANEQVAPLVSSAKRDCQTAIQEVRTNCLYSVYILYVHMFRSVQAKLIPTRKQLAPILTVAGIQVSCTTFHQGTWEIDRLDRPLGLRPRGLSNLSISHVPC